MTQKQMRQMRGVYTMLEVQRETGVSPAAFRYHRLGGAIPRPSIALGGKRRYYTKAQREMILEYFGQRTAYDRLGVTQ